MGTQVHYKSYFPGYYPMRDLNDDPNSGSWPLFYGDNNLSNGPYYAGFLPKTVSDAYPGCDKDALKQKILEHDAIFRDQVQELHRLYRTQTEMMEEFKRKDLNRHRASMEPSSSSSFRGSQAPCEDTRKWHVPSYPLTNTGYARSTLFGADIDNSPLSCTKGTYTLASRLTPQNGCISKDTTEVLEARPSKVRKKLFDLQFPADAYTDDPEDAEQRDINVSGTTSFTPNGECKMASENSMKFPLGGFTGERTCNSHLRSSVGLADLNEPVELDEPCAPSSIDVVGNSTCNGWLKGIDLSAKPNPALLSVEKEVMPRNHQRNHNGLVNNTSIENKVNERDWLSYTCAAGDGKNHLNSVREGLQRDKLALPSAPAYTVNHAHHSSALHLRDPRKEDLFRERGGWGFEASERSRNYPNKSYLEPVLASQVPSPYPFVGSSDVAAGTWPQFVSSWGKPAGSLSQTLASFHTHPSLVSSSSFSKSLQSSAQSHGVFGDKWNINSSCRNNPGLGTDPVVPSNGFYRGSSSASKDLSAHPSGDFNHSNSGRGDNIASRQLNNQGLEKSRQGSKYIDQKPMKDVNLNVAFVNNTWNDAASRRPFEIKDERIKCEDHHSTLPWLRAKPVNKSEGTNSRRDVDSFGQGFCHASPSTLSTKTEILKDLTQMFNGPSASNNHELRPKEEAIETQGCRKILGFPIFERVGASKDNDSSSLVSSTTTLRPSGENGRQERKKRVIDINMPCDASILESGDDEPVVEVMAVEKASDKDASCVRNFIDLNSCVTDDEDPAVPAVVSNTGSMRTKVMLEIDLEALPAPETEEEDILLPTKENEEETVVEPLDHKMEQPEEDEILRSAAEAIVDISSCHPMNLDGSVDYPSDASMAESLLWFADLITSGMDELGKNSRKETEGREGGSSRSVSPEGMDDFEAMTLELPETKEEDYMPKPFVPEIQNVEETGSSLLTSRPRRGQARRGRQRRDFQRDILPGLSSLSRHEVTEDIQTFGGLMRATGHPWSSGLNRRNGTRNGGARGRRRAVVETPPPPPPTTTTTTTTTTPSVVCTPPLVQKLNNGEVGLEDRSLTSWGRTPRRPRRQRCPAGNAPAVQLK